MPTLKHQLDNLDGVDAALQPFYEKNEQGKYFLQVQGMVAKSVVDEFRTNNIDLSNKLKTFEGVDPKDYKRLKDLESKFTGKPDEAAVETEVQKRVGTMKSEYEGKIKTLSESNTTMGNQLQTLVVDSAIRTAAIKTGVRPEAVDDVLLRGKSVFKFENGAAIPYDSKGQPIYGKDGTTHMTPEEWTGSLKKTAPHLFPQSTGSGANGTGKGGAADTSKMSSTQKISAGLEAQGG